MASSVFPVLEKIVNSFPSPEKCETEVAYHHHEIRSVGWGEGRPELQDISSEGGFALRVLVNGGQGLVKSPLINRENFPSLFNQAMAAANLVPKDNHRRMGKLRSDYPAPIPLDKAVFSEKLELQLERLKGIEKTILETDKRIKKVVKMRIFEERETKALVNNWGLTLETQSTATAFSLEVLATQDSENEVGWEGRQFRFGEQLNMNQIARQVTEDVIHSLGGRPVKSGPYPVVFHPRVGTQLLRLLADALSAESVQLHRSIFNDQMGKDVASPVVTLIDDPLMPRGVASAPFDDEGIPHEKIKLIENGILKDFFYDIRSAQREGRKPNGHGIRPSLASQAFPKPTNFFMEGGNSSLDKMLGMGKEVILIKEVMGLHMADPISGEFSFGAFGHLYEGGRFSRPVRGITIAGTVGQILKDISHVSNDITWYGPLGAPSFLVPQLSIGGN